MTSDYVINYGVNVSYTKLFSSIVASTIWQESKETKILWVTMLAVKNQFGVVEASVPGLAKFAGLSLKETEAGLKSLKAKDPYSRTKENEGRRIEDCDGGWVVLNHEKYRAMESKDDRREKMRVAQAKFRQKGKVLRVEVDPVKRRAKGLEPLPPELKNGAISPPPEEHNGSYKQWQMVHPGGNEV